MSEETTPDPAHLDEALLEELGHAVEYWDAEIDHARRTGNSTREEEAEAGLAEAREQLASARQRYNEPETAMIYYTAGHYLTEPEPDRDREVWYVFAHDGETGGVLEVEHGPMNQPAAQAMADQMNRGNAPLRYRKEAAR